MPRWGAQQHGELALLVSPANSVLLHIHKTIWHRTKICKRFKLCFDIINYFLERYTIVFYFSTVFAVFSTQFYHFSTSCQLFSTPPFKFSLPALFYSEQSTFFTLPLHTPFWAVCSLNKFQVAPDQDCRSSNHEYSTSSEEQETQSAPQSGQVQKSCRILDHLIIWSCYKYTSKFVHQNVNSVLIGQFLEILLEAFICLGLS